MKNQIVATRADVTTEQLMELVESLGGYWNSEPTLNQGVIERGTAAVYLSSSRELDVELEDEEARYLHERLDGVPKAFIDIHIGHGGGSDSLAKEVRAAILERWGGTLL